MPSRNRADMPAKIDEFRALEEKVRDASNAKRDLFEKRGSADFIAEGDPDAIQTARQLMAALGIPELLYDIGELCGLVPVEYRRPMVAAR